MNEESEVKSDILPAKYRVLSGSAIKLIAVVTMLIDHAAYAFPTLDKVVLLAFLGKTVTLYTVMRLIGRIAFPIYAFLLTEGFANTHDKTKYGINLLAFAVISEIPWNLFHCGGLLYPSQNVLFTLFLGYLGIYVYETFKNDRAMMLVLLTGIIVVSIIMRSDYGAKGVAIIMLLYVLREEKPLGPVFGTCILANGAYTLGAAAGFSTVLFYNGKRGFIKGKVLKYAFYLFYPVHLLLIYFLKTAIIG